MSVFFGESHRRLQDEHGTRRLADRLEDHAHAAFEARSATSSPVPRWSS